jgi:alkaline phosphatase D
MQTKTLLSAWLFLSTLTPLIGDELAPCFSTGIKTGEVSQTTAIIWSRLTSNTPKGSNLNERSTLGVPGSVQVSYWPEGAQQEMIELQPIAVDKQKDFTCQIMLSDLKPNTQYIAKVSALSESGLKGQELTAKFKTAPNPDQVTDIEAVVVTCQGHQTIDDPDKGHWAYLHMLTHQPDFFIHTGDVVYYDKGKAIPLSKTVAAARQRWNLMFSYDWNRDFHSEVSSYFMKDDPDTLKNDCWPGQSYGEISWEDGLALFKEQTPHGPLPYRNFRWGRDLEFWLMEGRDYRSPNKHRDGPNKSILGKEQKAWLKRTLKKSNATFKLVVFPSPVVGPDKKGKADNHSNSNFSHEGNELRKFLSQLPNTFVVCGDRHWQYASKDPVTGLIEVCSGPINNEHAKIGGSAHVNKDYHLYYGGGKGGYLRIAVTRVNDIPQISFIWHGDRSASGAINHKLLFHASQEK